MARGSNSLPLFLKALRASIVNAGVTTVSCCQITTADDFPKFSQGNPVVNIIPGDFKEEDQGGAGQTETIFRGEITFRVITENILDEAISDETALTDQNTTAGLYVTVQKLLPVIRFWDQADPSGNGYLAEPMRFRGGIGKPKRDENHAQYVYLDMRAEANICIATGGSNS